MKFTSSLVLAAALTACGGSDTMSLDASITANAQTPPITGKTDVDAWVAAASYKTWKCESAVHASRSPSPHGFNRICSNDLVVANATSTAPWSKGAAAVKELYVSLDATTPVGYAVYVKTAVDTADGANWYWYERTADGVVADGTGGSGPPREICVGCHMGAGMDTMHTPSPGSHDEIYTPVH